MASHTFPTVATHLDFLHILSDADILASYAIVYVNAHTMWDILFYLCVHLSYP